MYLWVKLVNQIHGSYQGGPNFYQNCRVHGVWSKIAASINSLHIKNIIPLSTLKKQVNNGKSTKFWADVWLCDTPLKQKFPRLYRLDIYPDCTVHDKWNSGWIWTWSRSINGGVSKAQLNELFGLLGNSFLTDKDDSWIWSLGNSTVFNVKDTRNLIDDSTLPNSPTPTRWCRFIPKKVNILIWRTLRDRIPTRWNLSRKGIEINSLSCPICAIGPETIYHLFWDCSLATALWSKIFNRVDLLLPSCDTIQVLYDRLEHYTFSSSHKLIMEAIIGVAIWVLWNFRNESIFGAQVPLRSTLFDKLNKCIRTMGFS
ncbi:RNA-directed DNA polymerase, eukaryota [Artemisia annua]|uniref:RNA-directed DNA polymerase, eukaryota n=1 Tax=Artemisia annua TaxID=35608 RepID=A0A2U1Q6Y2_ARTAN|nr:RNA-directed DNA polymerase, eukaryota [Artemisia annua]